MVLFVTFIRSIIDIVKKFETRNTKFFEIFKDQFSI